MYGTIAIGDADNRRADNLERHHGKIWSIAYIIFMALPLSYPKNVVRKIPNQLCKNLHMFISNQQELHPPLRLFYQYLQMLIFPI